MDYTYFRYEVPATDDPNNVIVAVYLREKKSSLTYSPSNLFGQPLLVGVPASDTNYEQLYDVVLRSLSRYVTAPAPDEEWWKKPIEMQNGVDAAAHTASNNGPATVTTAPGMTNGDAAETDAKTVEDTSGEISRMAFVLLGSKGPFSCRFVDSLISK